MNEHNAEWAAAYREYRAQTDDNDFSCRAKDNVADPEQNEDKVSKKGIC